jgi:hypothetical protein
MGQKIAVGALAIVLIVGAAGGNAALDKLGSWVRTSGHYVSQTWDAMVGDNNNS